jgi:hypothetical protein
MAYTPAIITDYNTRILAKLKEYAALRKSLALIPDPAPTLVSQEKEKASGTDSVESNRFPQDHDQVSAHNNASDMVVDAKESPTIPAPQTMKGNGRQLLSEIAQMTDDTVRSSREKLNITRFACGLVRSFWRNFC